MGHRNKILRNVKEVKKNEMEDNIPDEFLCPITREVMSDPVIAAGLSCTVFLVCLLYYCANVPHIVLQLYYILLYYTIIQYLCHQGRRKQCYFGGAT